MMALMSDHELDEAQTEFQRCIDDRDRRGAEQVLDTEYALVFVQPGPAIVTRAQWLDTLADYHVHSYEVDERHTHIDVDVAAVLQRVRMTATVLGQDRGGVFILTDVWRLRPDGWKVWRRHSTPLTSPVLPDR